MDNNLSWEDYLMLVTLLNLWDLEDEFNYQSDKLDKNESTDYW